MLIEFHNSDITLYILPVVVTAMYSLPMMNVIMDKALNWVTIYFVMVKSVYTGMLNL